jgi:methyl halide transferase
VELNSTFWNERWLTNDTQWDIGYPSPAIVDFVNEIQDKSIRILIPGCGNAYEAEYLHNKGFTNVFVVDYAEEALRRFAERVPSFPKKHLIVADFFSLGNEKFDLVIEQTFFCAIDPSLRVRYAETMKKILSNNGVLCGLLFIQTPNAEGPPFNGTYEEYQELFGERFTIRKMEPCMNSIKPREGRELWFEVVNNK